MGDVKNTPRAKSSLSRIDQTISKEKKEGSERDTAAVEYFEVVYTKYIIHEWLYHIWYEGGDIIVPNAFRR